jgi:hypothetical protein
MKWKVEMEVECKEGVFTDRKLWIIRMQMLNMTYPLRPQAGENILEEDSQGIIK